MQIAQVFINEYSWNDENYANNDIAIEHSNKLIEILSWLLDKRKEYEDGLEIYHSKEGLTPFVEYMKIMGTQVSRRLKEKLGTIRNWQESEYQQHNLQNTYYKLVFDGNTLTNSLEYVTGNSLAEISERKIQNNHFALLLLNFSQESKVIEDFVYIIKQAYNILPTLVRVEQIDNLEKLKEWFWREVELRLIIDNQDVFNIFTKQLIDNNITRQFENWKIEEAKDILPFSKISNAFLDAYTQYYYAKDYSPEIYAGKHSEANILIEKVAKINGWERHIDLTSKNSRSVFKPAYNATGIIKYISADTQHLDFECHNENSQRNHKGSIAINAHKAKGTKGHQLKF
jgi:hypothetical protein